MRFETFQAGAWQQRYKYKSFEPVPVNHEWVWEDSSINALLEAANRALGELNAFSHRELSDLGIAREALAATGTAHLSSRAYMTLSGGEKQRVVIASALAQQPKVLLLDEPTASLDLGYQLEIAALLKQLNRERRVTMVLATHDLNLAASVCDTLVLVREGRVLMQGPTNEVLTSATVEQLYGVLADVSFHEGAGHMTVIPVRRP